MRIAFVSHWGGRGGAEKALLEIIQAAKSSGHHVTCFVPCTGGLSSELARIDVPVVVMPYPWFAGERRWLAPLHLLRTPLAVYRLSKALRGFDVVYSNSAVICVGALAAKVAGIPHIWHLHEAIRPGEGIQFYLGQRFSEYMIRKLSRVVVGASKAVLEALKQTGEVLYLPPKVSKVDRRPSGALVVVGCLSKLKRVGDAIEAVRLTGVPLRIVGDGEEMSALRKQAEGLPVTFVGSVADASQEIANALALVNCSAVEGFGRVTIEAMALGTPVIAAAGGANLELVRHDETGLLFEAGNVRALAEQIARVQDRGFADRLANRAQGWIESVATADGFRDRLNAIVSKAAPQEQQRGIDGTAPQSQSALG